MIASSLKNAEGDPIIDLLLKKGADVSTKSVSGQVYPLPFLLNHLLPNMMSVTTTERPPLRHLQSQPLHRPHPHRQQVQRESKG